LNHTTYQGMTDERLDKLRDDELQLGDVIPILPESLWKRLNQ